MDARTLLGSNLTPYPLCNTHEFFAYPDPPGTHPLVLDGIGAYDFEADPDVVASNLAFIFQMIEKEPRTGATYKFLSGAIRYEKNRLLTSLGLSGEYDLEAMTLRSRPGEMEIVLRTCIEIDPVTRTFEEPEVVYSFQTMRPLR